MGVGHTSAMHNDYPVNSYRECGRTMGNLASTSWFPGVDYVISPAITEEGSNRWAWFSPSRILAPRFPQSKKIDRQAVELFVY